MGERRIRRIRRDGEELALVSYEIVVPPGGELTKAEAEVARLVALGLSNREIANKRASGERTVANQLKSIFRKLGVQSRVELVKLLV
jgi:DNA-binding CsgD family transcriptional regulator